MNTTTIHPWASVGNGKWHKTAIEATNFRNPVRSLCGKTFFPTNIQAPCIIPDGVHHTYICAKCAASTQTL